MTKDIKSMVRINAKILFIKELPILFPNHKIISLYADELRYNIDNTKLDKINDIIKKILEYDNQTNDDFRKLNIKKLDINNCNMLKGEYLELSNIQDLKVPSKYLLDKFIDVDIKTENIWYKNNDNIIDNTSDKVNIFIGISGTLSVIGDLIITVLVSDNETTPLIQEIINKENNLDVLNTDNKYIKKLILANKFRQYIIKPSYLNDDIINHSNLTNSNLSYAYAKFILKSITKIYQILTSDIMYNVSKIFLPNEFVKYFNCINPCLKDDKHLYIKDIFIELLNNNLDISNIKTSLEYNTTNELYMGKIVNTVAKNIQSEQLYLTLSSIYESDKLMSTLIGNYDTDYIYGNENSYSLCLKQTYIIDTIQSLLNTQDIMNEDFITITDICKTFLPQLTISI